MGLLSRPCTHGVWVCSVQGASLKNDTGQGSDYCNILSLLERLRWRGLTPDRILRDRLHDRSRRIMNNFILLHRRRSLSLLDSLSEGNDMKRIVICSFLMQVVLCVHRSVYL